MKKLVLLIVILTITINVQSQNVGVDVVAPLQKLDVAGGLRIGNTSNGLAGSLRWNGTNLQYHDGTSWQSITNNTDNQTLTLALPNLSISGGNSVNLGILQRMLVDADNDTKVEVEQSADEDMIRFTTLGAERVIINNTGNVGIGISTPSNRLDVNGQIRMRTGSAAGYIPVGDLNGVMSWTAPGSLFNSTIVAGNGLISTSSPTTLTIHAVGESGLTTAADNIRLGGTLLQNTVISQGGFDMDINLNGTGDFAIQSNNGNDKFFINELGDISLGGDMSWRDESATGTLLMSLSDVGVGGNDGRLVIYQGGLASVDLNAAVGFVVNEQGADRDLRIEGVTDANLLFTDASTDRVAVGANNPTQKLDVNGKIRMRTGAAVGFVPVSDAAGVMTWTNPNTINTSMQDADADTKIQVEKNPDEDKIRFDTFGVERMVIDNTGKIGIGVTPGLSIDRQVHVADPNGAKMLLAREDANTNTGETLGEFQFDSRDDTQASSVDASALIRGIAAEDHGNSNKGGHMAFLTKPVGGPGSSAATERMRIQSDGNIGIGVAVATYKLHVNGKVKTIGVNETSDGRLKKDILSIENPLSTIENLRGVTYHWRTDEFPQMQFEDKLQYGLIAQEVEKVLPELVSTDSEGWKSVEYTHLVPVLLEAIKEQQTMINNLKIENFKANSELGDLRAELMINQDGLNRVEKMLEKLIQQTSDYSLTSKNISQD